MLFATAMIGASFQEPHSFSGREGETTAAPLAHGTDGFLHGVTLGQVSLTDPDARSMATSGRGTGIVGYNVQTAVNTQYHLIVAHEVTNLSHDRTHLSSMAQPASQTTGAGGLKTLADRGYFESGQIRECEQSGIEALVPKPLTSNSKAAGRFDKQTFALAGVTPALVLARAAG